MRKETCFIFSLLASGGLADALQPQRRGSAKVPRARRAVTLASTPALAGGLKVATALRGGVDFSTAIAPVLGATMANGMFASGFSEVLAKRKEGNLGDFNPLPMPIIFGNCLGWLTYSYLKKDPFVFAANAPGLLLGIWYTMTMLRLAPASDAKRVETTLMCMVAIHLAASAVSAFVLPDRAAMITLYGFVNNAILLMYYGAPLSTIGKVLKTKSAASIYFPTVLVNGLNGAFWAVYALAIKDKYLFIPNLIGVSLAAIQILLCLLFGNKK